MKNSDDPGRRKRGRPKRELAPPPGAILNAALRAFAHDGFEGSSLRSIAADAGVDVALASRQFGSKLDLWKATVDALSERMVDTQAEIAALHRDGAPIAERLRSALRHFIAFSMAVPELGKFFIDETAKAGERRDYVLARIWQPHRDVMRPLLEEGLRAGIVRGRDAELLLLMLIGAVAMPLLMTDLVPHGSESEMMEALQAHVTALFLID